LAETDAHLPLSVLGIPKDDEPLSGIPDVQRQAKLSLDVYGIIPYIVQTEIAMPATSHRKQPIRELKKDRLELRVATSAKALILRAMAVSGLTAGDLAYEGARRILDEHERMALTGANRDAFLGAVVKPPEPTDKLIAALRRHRSLMS
jgi:uncharacterized protein (DUF1778 family)